MKTLIEQYLVSKTNAWSKNTLRSEGFRLKGLLGGIDGNPEVLWKEMERKDLKPYSKVTGWTRVSEFWNWAVDNGHLPGPNKYKTWRDQHGQLFKNSYERKTPTSSLKEARKQIEAIPNEIVRYQALSVLDNGLRVSEYNSFADGSVIGKGNKKREVFGNLKPEGGLSYFEFYKALKKVGLKPHDLRKIRASDLARKKGIREEDLCKIMGWESFETAKAYLAPKSNEALKDLFRK